MKQFFMLCCTLTFYFSTLAQCPTSSQITSAGKCIRISWPTPPSPLPAYIIYNGVQFNFSSGLGTSGSPAEYKDPSASGACSSYTGSNAVITLPTGELCSYTGGILPLQWLSFTITKKDNNQSTIIWKVQETNCKEFFVETSNDGNNFYSIATIQSQQDGLNTYNFILNNTFNNNMYFRIKLISKDGSISYSSIIKQYNLKTINSISLFPNPTATNIFINSTNHQNSKRIAQIIDLQGKILNTIILNNPIESINVSNLKEGLYTIKINDGASTLFKKL